MMPAETPQPPLPKRPSNRRSPLGKKKPADVEHDCAMLTAIEKACVLISVEKSTGEAATKLDMTLEEVDAIMASAPVNLYLSKLQEKEMTELARLKVRKYRQLGINRARIEERLMELAMLDPSETKGSVDGQVKALAALADKFGYAAKEDPLDGKTPAELEAIVAKGHSRLIEGRTNGVQ